MLEFYKLRHTVYYSMTFYDNKKRFSWAFFSGWPGELRVKIHKFIDTKGLGLEAMETLKQQAYNLIYTELMNDTNKYQQKD